MVGRMQHATPENPYALPLDIEKGNHLKPPRCVASRYALQTRLNCRHRLTTLLVSLA